MKILVVGKSGQVALSLAEIGQHSGHEIISMGRPDLDITQLYSVKTCVNAVGPDLVINAAAYTAVDAAESNEAQAYLVNETGAYNLSVVTAKRGIPLVHISTDYVFDGTKSTRYSETDIVTPLGVYGASKLAGEKAVIENNSKHFVFRTAWVYSPFGNNFVKTMLRLAASRDEISVVDDQIGSPTSAIDIAGFLLSVATHVESTDNNAEYGVYHMAGEGIASWADLAETAIERAFQRTKRITKINRIESKDFPTPTQRPMNSRLDTNKTAQAFGIRLPHWRDSVISCVDRILAER